MVRSKQLIDHTDEKIISALQVNARLSCRQIAKKAGISVATASKHMQRLEKERIITGYVPVLDFEKLGYDLDVLISVKVAHGKFKLFEDFALKHPSVMVVYDITGEFDLMVVAHFKTRRTLDTFLKKIQSYTFVEKTLTYLILNTFKKQTFQL